MATGNVENGVQWDILQIVLATTLSLSIFLLMAIKIDGNIILNAQKEYVGNIKRSGKTTKNTNVNIFIVSTG